MVYEFKKGRRLGRKFYTKKTLDLAREFLGKYIVRIDGKRKIEGKIIETEAYVGPADRASHAFRNKKTARNAAEYLIGGHIYIYLVYGMYWQLNISTAAAGVPECILIRALELPPGADQKIASGPGKLCRYLELDKSFYAEDLVRSQRIWLEDRGGKIGKILATPRIGIDYAGPYWAGRKWRFVIK